MIVFDEDRDADAFAADIKARQVPGGKTSILVDYGSGLGGLRGAVVSAVPVDPGVIFRPEDSGRPEGQGPGQ